MTTAAAETAHVGRWYAADSESVAAELGVDPSAGLTAAEAASRLARNGPNELPAEKPPSSIRRFLAQYASYMQLILVGAAIVSLAIEEWSTAVILFVITLLNAVIGLRQEGKAESAMNALKSLMRATARVRRDGAESVVPAEELVTGDVVLLAAGDQVPADGRIVSASALQIDESALTGESVAASKDATTLPDGELGPGDQSNMAFMHCPVTHGSGTMIVTETGGATQVGRIAHMLSATAREETPLTRQMNTLTLWIIGAAGITMVVMFALGLHRGQAWDALFVSAVALAISAVPEALPTVVQVVLSTGSLQLARRKAIVKDLPSVETLGFTSAINSDKTGTLTMNQMTAVELVDATDRYTISGIGYGLEGKVTHAAGHGTALDGDVLPFVVANDARLVDGKVVGDPTEGALLVLAHKAGLDIDATRDALPRLATLPFDPTYKLMATFNRTEDAAGKEIVRVLVKGAAPAVLGHVTSARANGKSVSWSDDIRQRIEQSMQEMGERGLRVMAAAQRELTPAGFDPDGDLLGYITELELASVVAMVDPPREESKQAVAAAQAAHIEVRMITGDDVVTGAAIAKQLGIPGEAMLGADFAALSEQERLDRIEAIGVVGRVAPEHKVLLAETLKKKGHVVSMTGDGVNDAPAIKAADIGIAMGSGTEVAKNAGRMILSDDNFATIVYAVEQGRKLFDNLTKYIRFVLLLLVAFVTTFLGAAIFNIAAGEPFTAGQALWIHFFVNAPFGIALGFDRETPGLMSLRPKPRGESVVTTRVLVGCGLVGLFIAAANLLLIQLGKSHYDDVMVGQSMALTAFTLMLVVAAFESRSETGTIFTTDTFNSRQLNWTALAEIAGAWLITQADFLRRLLDTTDLRSQQFGIALLSAVALLLVWESAKWVARKGGPSPRPGISTGPTLKG
jgi:Ca2+-transporting ATPase